MACQTFKLTWNDIEIEARYDPQYCNGIIAHLEIESIHPIRARLPVTQTGYRSHFHTIGMIEAEYDGDVVAAVTDWLNKEAQSKDWKIYQEEARQYVLL